MPRCSRVATSCRFLTSLLLLSVGTAALGAQTVPTAMTALQQPITLDGAIDEPAWQEVSPLPMTMYAPVHRGTASEETDIRVAYDSEYLYAAGVFYESDPKNIRANSLFRDRWSGDDAFVLFVDSFNDNRTVRRFTVTPAGTRIDELIGDDGADRNLDWNAPWDVATVSRDDGWSFEMRIPFASLRFQERPEGVVMGITVSRFLASRAERMVFPDIDPQSRFDRPSETHDFLLSGIESARPLYITPYTLATTSRVAGASASDPAASENAVEAGVDVKYALSDRAFIDLSVNTDFAQVEADDQQVNLTRFPLFYPEKRQFFQERSDLFTVGFSNGGRVFHSRRIGLSADRTPVRILGGARFVGRLGEWDVGVLDMQSASTDDASAENFGVLRAMRRVINPNSRVGAVLTTRARDGEVDVTSGIDGQFNLAGNTYFTGRYAATSNHDESDGLSLIDRGIAEIAIAQRVQRGLTWWAKLVRAGSGYDPRLGFLPRQDYRHISLYGVFNTEGSSGDQLRSYGPGVIINTFHGNNGGGLESLYAGHWWNYEFWNGTSGWLQITRKREVVDQSFGLGDGVEVVAGDHSFVDAWFAIYAGPGRQIRPTFQARYGSFYDGTQLELISSLTWNLSRHLELSGGHSLNTIRFPDRGQALDVHSATLRARLALNTQLQGTVLAQYNNIDDRLGLNVRLRYNIAEGRDLWLVYGETLNTDREIPGAPIGERRPSSTNRDFAVKMVWTFQP